jgi:protein-L-isoaspartate(D-aspartate) O-methyltransferase
MQIESARQQMIHHQVRAWEVLDERVLQVFERVPRELFVPEAWRDLAFADTEIPLGHDERMLAPKVVGRILQALELEAEDHALEVGTGSGFLSACLSLQCASVRSLEIHQDLAAAARTRLEAFGAPGVQVVDADAYSPGALGERPWNVIVLTGSLPVPDERFQQCLAVGGRLFAVVGEPPNMEARLVRRVSESQFAVESLFETSLRPLLGARRAATFRF